LQPERHDHTNVEGASNGNTSGRLRSACDEGRISQSHAIKGPCGAYVLRRQTEADVELIVLTLWDSMEAIRRFAGPEPNKAVIEPEARAALASFDEYVTHFEVAGRL
jgi:heme-degrading monooxygenase HmoA